MSDDNRNKEELFAAAAAELDGDNRDAGLWARCLAECGGDENKARALYLTRRVERLQEDGKRERVETTPPIAMGTICPQCNVTVPPGEVVCTNCGSHLHAVPSVGKKGARKLIAFIGGGVLVMVALLAGILLVTKKKDGGKANFQSPPSLFPLGILPGLAKAKGRANRVKCVMNCLQIYKGMLAFAQDNGERLPWQLTPSGVRNHLDPAATAGAPRFDKYGLQTGAKTAGVLINEVHAHPHALQTAGVWGILAVKREVQTPKILHSPCDPTRAAQNELVQENWKGYNTKVNGASGQLGGGTSYTLVRGADTPRPSSVLLVTRNWSGNNLGSGHWLGSQGQLVMMDGSAKQANNADFGESGNITRAARQTTGGVATGETSLNIIRGRGLCPLPLTSPRIRP